jgi:hypothetical protein
MQRASAGHAAISGVSQQMSAGDPDNETEQQAGKVVDDVGALASTFKDGHDELRGLDDERECYGDRDA